MWFFCLFCFVFKSAQTHRALKLSALTSLLHIHCFLFKEISNLITEYSYCFFVFFCVRNFVRQHICDALTDKESESDLGQTRLFQAMRENVSHRHIQRTETKEIDCEIRQQGRVTQWILTFYWMPTCGRLFGRFATAEMIFDL